MWKAHVDLNGITHYAKYLADNQIMTVCGPLTSVIGESYSLDDCPVTCFQCLCVVTPKDIESMLAHFNEYWLHRPHDPKTMKLTQWIVPIK